jgi:hypothetical protein
LPIERRPAETARFSQGTWWQRSANGRIRSLCLALLDWARWSKLALLLGPLPASA